MDSQAAFLVQSREYLTGHYLPKIRAAVETLSEDDLWWRPNPASNSVGNLLLHLAGNLRQWVVSGVGGAPDQRDRAGEFARREPGADPPPGADPAPGADPPLPSCPELLATLTEAVLDADAVLARTDPASLDVRLSVQGREVTTLQAIYHAVEHLALHAGQIFYIAKQRSGKDLGFYRLEGAIPRPAWPGHPTRGSA